MRVSVTSALLLALSTQCRQVSPKQQQRFLTEPTSTSVLEGKDLVLECSIADQVGELQWTRDDFGLGTDRELVGYSRYKMVGADLHITNVSLAEDDAKFQCQVGATETSPPLRSRYAIVQVVAAPQPPVITAGPRMLVRAGRRALVQCISKGGRPATQIRWRKAGQLVTEGVEEKVETLEDGKRSMTVSTLTFLAGRNLSGTFLECEARSEVEGAAERRVGTTLEVEFEPRVELVVDKEAVFEGDMVRLACKVEARPQLVEYQWWVGGQEVEEARGAAEFLLEAARKQSGQMVTCLARNRIGQGSADYKLDIQYAPVFVKTPQDVTGDAGLRVKLECQADSNPVASYTWTRSTAPSEPVGLGSSLSFRLSNLTAGLYTCTVTSPSSPSPVSRSARVSLRGPPTILPGRELQFGAIGSSVRVVCEAEATPSVESFLWSFQGGPINPGSEYSILETQHGPMVRSSLLITSLTDEQLGEYTCTVTNALGSASTSVNLRPIDGLPLLIMVAAAIGGLLLTLVLIVIVVTCRRMAQSPSAPAADKPAQQPDQLSNSSSQGTKAATLSTLSAPDDLDGSDSLPEYHANYIASNHQHVGYKGQQQQQQPDVVHSHGGDSGLEPGWHGYGHSRHLYTVTSDPYYRRFMASSSGDLQDGNYRHYGSPSHTESPVVTGGGDYLGESNVGYGLVGRPNYAVNLQEDLNESSIGTHV